ncbi:hypothetical protein HDE_06770 [Halotydeus destructor]|nr:hypothetical protein HDE_06770 [Halotydeus destructor]
MHRLLIACLIVQLLVTVEANFAGRRYKVNKGLRNVAYRGSLLSYKNSNLPTLNSLLASNRQSSAQPLPSNETASLEDNFSELLFDVISEKFKSKVRTGVPEMDIPSMDPLTMSRINLKPMIGGDDFDVKLKNVRVAGLSTFYLKDLTPKLAQLRFRISLLFPKITIDCQYAVNGSIYDVFDLHGTGTSSLEYNDVLVRTTVYLELNNGTLRITTADPPMVDFASTRITFKNSDGRENTVEQGHSTAQNMASELGPLLFWMLADHVVEEVDFFAAKFVNDAIKNFQVPDTFKPMVTWLVRRRSQSLLSGLSGLSSLYPSHGAGPMRRYSPISVLGEIVQVLGTATKPVALPSALESLKKSFGSNLRRFIK